MHLTHSIHDGTRWFVYAEICRNALVAVVVSAYEFPFDDQKYRHPKAAPYALTLTMDRINQHTSKDITERSVQVCNLSGEIKPGGYLRIRLDAFVKELKSDLDDTTPSYLRAHVRMRGSRSYQVENANTATAPLNIGNSSYEFVSMEILGLYSPYFENLFYSEFAESANNGAVHLQPLRGENEKCFVRGVRMMLQWMHHRTFADDVTPKNASYLIHILKRYQIDPTPMYKFLDAHLVRYCLQWNDGVQWDAAIILSKKYPLPETARRVPSLYGANWASAADEVDRMRDKLDLDTLKRLFHVYRSNAQLHSKLKRCCFLYFEFAAAERAIVQINRVGVPGTTAAVIEEFARPPRFHWDWKGRLISNRPVSHELRTRGEQMGKSFVPQDAWAFLIRAPKDKAYGGRPHYILTTSRPDGLYLGYVVKGTKHVIKNEKCRGAGMHFLAI